MKIILSSVSKMFAKQVVFALFAVQVIAGVVAQAPATTSNNVTIWLDVDSYISENSRQYNATLQSYLNQINDIKDSLEDQMKLMNKAKGLLLDTIQETYEKIDPLESLSFPSKYCVDLYRPQVPYADIVKTNIETCISSARSYASSIVASPTSYYNTLKSYYTNQFKNGLNACVKQHGNVKTLNYTLCVTSVVSTTTAYTISNRKNFATSIQSAKCALDSRVDIAASCVYTYYKPSLTSIGAATRLIDDCLHGYLEYQPGSDNNNNGTNISYGCPNVIYMEVKDADSQNSTSLSEQVKARSYKCLEIRFV